MQFDEVNWAPTLITLGIGAVVGIILVINALRRKSAVAAPSAHALELRDLEGQRDALVAELQELDDASAKTTVEERARMRYELELKLATTLRDLRGERAAAREEVFAESSRDAEAVPDRYATARGFLWGIGGAAAVAGLVVFVLQTSEPKEQPATPASSGGEQPLVSDAQIAELRRGVESHPDDLDLRVDLAAAYLMRNQTMEVWNETSYVLQRSPDHPRALSYAALVKLQMGDYKDAEEMLQRALKKDPTLLDGWTHLAIVYAQTGRFDEARAAIASAKQKHPEQSAMLDGFASELDQMMRQTPAQAPPAAAAPEAGPSADAIAGVVEVKKGAPQPQPNWSIFVIARDASAPAGPPVAVKRLAATAFPLAFTLDIRDSMMGNPLPPKMTVEARVDRDGNPMLSAAGEISSPIAKVDAGAKNVQLVLQ